MSSGKDNILYDKVFMRQGTDADLIISRYEIGRVPCPGALFLIFYLPILGNA